MEGGSIRAEGLPSEVINAKLLSDVFGQSMTVVEHPTPGCPLVLITDGERWCFGVGRTRRGTAGARPRRWERFEPSEATGRRPAEAAFTVGHPRTRIVAGEISLPIVNSTAL